MNLSLLLGAAPQEGGGVRGALCHDALVVGGQRAAVLQVNPRLHDEQAQRRLGLRLGPLGWLLLLRLGQGRRARGRREGHSDCLLLHNHWRLLLGRCRSRRRGLLLPAARLAAQVRVLRQGAPLRPGHLQAAALVEARRANEADAGVLLLPRLLVHARGEEAAACALLARVDEVAAGLARARVGAVDAVDARARAVQLGVVQLGVAVVVESALGHLMLFVVWRGTKKRAAAQFQFLFVHVFTWRQRVSSSTRPYQRSPRLTKGRHVLPRIIAKTVFCHVVFIRGHPFSLNPHDFHKKRPVFLRLGKALFYPPLFLA